MKSSSRIHLLRVLFQVFLFVAALVEPFHAAQAVEPRGTALSWIPQEAVFYHAWFRNREQLEAVASSRAWARLQALPAWQEATRLLNSPEAELAWLVLRSHWDRLDTSVAQGQVLLEDPQIRRFLAVLGDMFSDEVFVYGDATCLDAARLLRRIATNMRSRPVTMHWDAERGTFDEKKMVGSPVVKTCLENLPLLRVPNLVFGFHLRDRNRAMEQLGKLELLGHLLTWADPRWKGRVEKQLIGETSYLVFSLDGAMLPEASLDGIRSWVARDEDAEKLISRIQEMDLVIALGIRDDYLVVSVGESPDALARLGKNPRLMDLPDCKPLVDASQENLISACYVAKSLRAVLAETSVDADTCGETVEDLFSLAGFTPKTEKALRKKLAEMAQDVAEAAPRPGVYVSVCLWVGRGIESYAYDFGERPELDAMKPFRLLDHAGGRPILAISLRSTFSGRCYDRVMDWVAEGAGRLEVALVEKMSPSNRTTLQQTTATIKPLASYLRHVLREMLAMVLADGQALIVLDADATTTTRWRMLRGHARPMPLPEPAIVLDTTGVNNVRRVLAEGRQLVQGLLAAIGLVDPSSLDSGKEIRESLPRPPTILTPGSWKTPNLGLDKTKAVLSLSRNHAERLLEPTPLEMGLFNKNPRKRVLAYAFDGAGLIETLRPWLDAAARRMAGENHDDQLANVADHLHTLLDVLAVVRTVSAEVYQEHGAWITHTLLEIRDVE